MHDLAFGLYRQLPEREYEVRVNAGRLRRREDRYRLTILVPDVFVVPREFAEPLRGRPGLLEAYDAPVPFVAEIWAPVVDPDGLNSDEWRIEEYRRRGDLDIWLLHADDRALMMWRRQPDGTYSEETVTGGLVEPIALPNVTIDLDEFFARL